jgi:predicted dehydrogenase
VKAGELVKAGTIGKVIQTIGLGPHRISLSTRPPWFFDKKYFGGIITDIASHQFDQFLHFTVLQRPILFLRKRVMLHILSIRNSKILVM